MSETKDALLDAAERLFAEQGIESTSLRAITSEADANLAAVNYHFGSKERLIQAVLERRLAPLMERRCQLLADFEREAGPEGPQLEQVIRAFVEPTMQLRQGNAKALAAMMARLPFEYDPKVLESFRGVFAETFERFANALERCLPELDRAQLLWRFHFAAGAMAAAIARPEFFQVLAGLEQDGDDQTVDRLIRFIAGGFRSPTAELREAVGVGSDATRGHSGSGVVGAQARRASQAREVRTR